MSSNKKEKKVKCIEEIFCRKNKNLQNHKKIN